MVTLLNSYNGYTTGTLTGKRFGYEQEIELPNGKLIYLYESDFTKA